MAYKLINLTEFNNVTLKDIYIPLIKHYLSYFITHSKTKNNIS